MQVGILEPGGDLGPFAFQGEQSVGPRAGVLVDGVAAAAGRDREGGAGPLIELRVEVGAGPGEVERRRVAELGGDDRLTAALGNLRGVSGRAGVAVVVDNVVAGGEGESRRAAHEDGAVSAGAGVAVFFPDFVPLEDGERRGLAAVLVVVVPGADVAEVVVDREALAEGEAVFAPGDSRDAGVVSPGRRVVVHRLRGEALAEGEARLVPVQVRPPVGPGPGEVLL